MVRRSVDAYRVLSSESRVAILRLLEERATPLPVETVAEEVGLHVNTVREHLDRLVVAGFAARAPEIRRTRGRPRMPYRSTAAEATDELDQRVRDQLMRVLLTGFPEPEAAAARAEEAGEAWAADYPCETAGQDAGTVESQLAALHAHFGALGFEPDAEDDGLTLRLRHCPFAELREGNGDVVCRVHLGLTRGMLARHAGPLTVDRIVRVGQGCEVRLRERAAAQAGAEASSSARS
ncbi:transcriptional regulator [Actinotalea ferrariae CF5-4]|uniref:Transcriptional regulator n=1 Tax=Actinotalea ferrariae CF5-4 TaxID=948458 RepID=A0A021VLF3_9CELL|nr:helix-turn-helix domain-containing protein [Actinotalea ferrariae]EYR62011.1 transcriptional regulator [Actinotalea ferrariae CF5-4]